MELLGRLLSGLTLFLVSLAAGWWSGRKGWLPEATASALIRFIVTRLSPVVLCLSFWGLEAMSWRLLILPVIGGAVSLAALLPAWGYAKLARLSRPQTGSVLTCAAFSNLAFFGALIAFALYGEAAYSLAAVHMLYFSPLFYAVGFTIATRCGHAAAAAAPSKFSDELRFYPIAGLLLGCLLNVSNLPRPFVFGAVNHLLIPLDTALYVIAVSSQVHWDPPGGWVRPAAAMSLIKFVYCPLVAWALVSWAGLEGLPKFVVLLQSAMPVGVSCLMLPLLFGLDKRLSQTLWVLTTALTIPWLLAYLPAIR